MHADTRKRDIIASLIADARAFRMCGPSDDSDEITAVTAGYHHLVVQFKRLAGPILPKDTAARLGGIDVEVNNIYSAYEARAELDALLPDVEAALESVSKNSMPANSSAKSRAKALPVPVCSIVGRVLGQYIYHHTTLETLFYEAGAVGEVPQGNCIVKCQSWLKRLHQEVPNPAAVLGKVIEEFMEVDAHSSRMSEQEEGRKRIRDVLARHGLSYHSGGLILGATAALPTKSLTDVLKARDLGEVDKEFERSLAHVESDPPAAIAAACSILESLFKVYIEDNGLELPSDQSLKPLWKTASKHLGFDPSAVEDEDIKKILSGMNSVVDGIGSLRTHRSTAHGQGRRAYRIQARHARLAVHASHTLVGFFLETWDERKRRAQS